MLTGISSACFYPLETEKSIKRCGEMGFSNMEVFVNSFSELHGELHQRIVDEINNYGINICSIHPFTSFAESYLIFGSYPRRVDDTIELYKNYFEFANSLGAKILVLHGGNVGHTVDNEEYFDTYGRLFSIGKSFGITVAHENVVKHRLQEPLFAKRMSDYLGNDFAMTLDIKQCRRAGVNPYDFVDFVGEKIIHVHISDSLGDRDCVVPFEGEFDFYELYKKLQEKNYDGKYIIELYRQNFGSDEELVAAAKKFDGIISNKI